MNITIKETGDKKTLTMKDLMTDQDQAYLFINQNGFVNKWSKDKDGGFILRQSEYEFWARLLAKEEKSIALVREHASLMTDDIYKEIWQAKTKGLEHFTQDRLDIIERVTTGQITAKTVGSKINGQMRIGQDTTIIHCYEEDGKYFIDCEGTFVLTTKRNRYEIPIGTAAAHIIGTDCVTLDGALDCPINLSTAQTKVVLDVLFNAIKKELCSVGCPDVAEYNLDDDEIVTQH